MLLFVELIQGRWIGWTFTSLFRVLTIENMIIIVCGRVFSTIIISTQCLIHPLFLTFCIRLCNIIFVLQELQQDVSKRAPVVVRINTTANQLADHTKQGSAKPLVESLKKLNSDWSRLKKQGTLGNIQYLGIQT